MADENAPDPVAAMFAVDDEAARGKAPEAELNPEPPADKEPQERDESGKFKGSEDKEKPADKPEAKAEEKPVEKEKRTDDMVPLAKHLSEKAKLKADLEARDITLKEFEKKLAALEAKLAPKPETPQAPDFVEDPKAYVDHNIKSVVEQIAEANKRVEAETKKAQETSAATAQQVHLQRMMGEVQQRERAFIAQNPDYYDALGHLRDIRAFQLREFNPEITEEQIRATIVQEETQLAVQLLSQGRDPTTTAYNLAQKYGYQKKASPPPEATKLPDPPSKRLPPDQTLGSSSPADEPVYKEGEVDPVDLALASVFKKRA